MIHEKISIQVEGGNKDTALYTYFWDDSKELNPGLLRPVVLICPGGGYAMKSDREAEAIAVTFMAMGYHAAVLQYSTIPAVYPAALLEAAKAVALLRENSSKWYIDPDKIIIQGFSAGGHLAASLGVFWSEQMVADQLNLSSELCRPNGLILNYPVITSGEFAHRGSFRNLLGSSYDSFIDKMSLEHQVNERVPKTFIWHTFTDRDVPVENSLLFVQALRKYQIPTEFHMYPVGPHGIGLGSRLTRSSDGYGMQKECESWVKLAAIWMESNFS